VTARFCKITGDGCMVIGSDNLVLGDNCIVTGERCDIRGRNCTDGHSARGSVILHANYGIIVGNGGSPVPRPPTKRQNPSAVVSEPKRRTADDTCATPLILLTAAAAIDTEDATVVRYGRCASCPSEALVVYIPCGHLCSCVPCAEKADHIGCRCPKKGCNELATHTVTVTKD
jgi:hypothetical protein